MSNKQAAAYHAADCNGACCRNPFGVCSHGRACRHHLREEAARIKEEREESARIEFAKAWLR